MRSIALKHLVLRNRRASEFLEESFFEGSGEKVI